MRPLKDIRIIQGDDKMIVAMPNKVYPDGQHHDVAHPINQETRKMFEDAILEEYNKADSEEADTEE